MTIKDPQTMLVLPTSVVVASESDPAVTYHVQLPYCPCKDYRYRRASNAATVARGGTVRAEELLCKHLATAMQTVGGWHSPEAADLTARIERALKAIGTAGRDEDTVLRIIALALTSPGGEFPEEAI
jgi:hypothetical protein